MADNYANPLQEAETDITKAQKAINGLLNPKEEETIGQQEPPKEEIKQNSPEPQNEESSTEEQPLEQENQETESQDEVTEDVSQSEEQIETQEKQDSTEEPTYTVKVAGQEFNVTLDELRNGYSRDADYRRKTEDLAYDKKQFQTESEKQRQDYSTKLSELNQMMSVAQQQLNAEINSADLEKLYEEDPTEAARIEHRLKKKQEKLNQAMQKTQSEQKKQFDGFLQDQQRKLVQKMPEFSNPEKASQLKTSMKNTLNSYGFNDQEIAQVYDHRIVMLVNDAMKFRNMQKAKPNMAKKISKPGKVFSSGVKQSKADINLKTRKDKLSRLRKSGSTKDAASIFLDMINNK
mgnify:FL=1|tara:strand:- start:1522 stop:2565 length:1044 start_codon:yes stop_codon:yes gene_type:complete